MSEKIINESDYTVVFKFHDDYVFPSIDENEKYTTDIAKAIVFDSKNIADDYGKQHCGKWTYNIMPTKITVEHRDDVLVI